MTRKKDKKSGGDWRLVMSELTFNDKEDSEPGARIRVKTLLFIAIHDHVKVGFYSREIILDRTTSEDGQ